MNENIDKLIKRMEKLINDDNSFGAYEEYTQMIDATYKEGLDDGINSTKVDIAKRMIKDGFSIEKVSATTKLSKTRIKDLFVK